jgi:hypothetical protein
VNAGTEYRLSGWSSAAAIEASKWSGEGRSKKQRSGPASEYGDRQAGRRQQERPGRGREFRSAGKRAARARRTEQQGHPPRGRERGRARGSRGRPGGGGSSRAGGVCTRRPRSPGPGTNPAFSKLGAGAEDRPRWAPWLSCARTAALGSCERTSGHERTEKALARCHQQGPRRGRLAPKGRPARRPLPLPAAPCRVLTASHRFFTPLRDTSNLRVGGSNPSRRAILPVALRILSAGALRRVRGVFRLVPRGCRLVPPVGADSAPKSRKLKSLSSSRSACA